MTAEEDDPLRTEPLRGDHPAQADGAVADDGRRRAWHDPRMQCCVMTRAHHVGEGEQRRQERVVLVDRERDERAVGLRDTHGLALAAVDVVGSVSASMEAGGVKPFPAEDTGAVRVEERGHDEVAGLQGAHICADGVDDADELVAHPSPGLGWLHLGVRPEVAAADAGAGDPNEGIGGLDEPGIGDVLDPNIPCAEHDGCAH